MEPARDTAIILTRDASWLQSTTFASFILARAIGGISEGNVQLSM